MNLHSASILAFAAAVCFTALIWTSAVIQERANMAEVHAHFTYAVRTARQSITQTDNHPRYVNTDGVPTTASHPTNTGAWISTFSGNAKHAPNGGPAYIVNNTGSEATGAIGVTATNYGREVRITRPPYLGLKAQTATVTANVVNYDPASGS